MAGFPQVAPTGFGGGSIEAGYVNDTADDIVAAPFSGGALAALQPIASIGAQNYGPWIEQQPYLKYLFEQAMQLYGRPFDETIGQSQDMRLRNANQSQGMIDQLTQQSLGAYGQAGQQLNDTSSALAFLLNPDILDPSTNKYLAAHGEALARPMYQQLNEQLLPQASSGAFDAGQYGSSREGVERGLAIGRTQQAVGDSQAKLYSMAYGQGLDALGGAVNSAGNISNLWAGLARGGPELGRSLMGLQDMPAQLYNAVGRERFMLPWENLNMYKGGVGGNYGKYGMEWKTDPGYKVGESLVNTFMGNFGSMLGGGMMCWVAEELYGPDSEKTQRIRSYVTRHEYDEGELGEFARSYRREGRMWAELIKRDEHVRSVAKELWDQLYVDATKEDERYAA